MFPSFWRGVLAALLFALPLWLLIVGAVWLLARLLGAPLF